jgi:formimidoylglutamate deiminase
VGETLFKGALAGGAQAAGQQKHGLSVGASADLVVLSEAEAFIATAPSTKILDRWLFALGSKAVRDVMVAGQWVVQDGRHIRQEEIDRAFHAALKRQQ